MKSRDQDRIERFFALLFSECVRRFDMEPLSRVEERLTHSFENLTPAEKQIVVPAFRRICKNLGVGIKVMTMKDVGRIILASSYWSYLTEAFAMEMSFDENSRSKRWAEVEALAQVSKDDIFKVSDFFERSSRSD